jgi:hypothetical protein
MSFDREEDAMPRKRHKPVEIVANLRQAAALVSRGQRVTNALGAICVTGHLLWTLRESKHHGITPPLRQPKISSPILLIGIVKKNGIMLVDFALVAERDDHLSAHDAVRRAALLRFRPIMMTTMAAMLGGVPLMLGTGTGSELRQPLGYAIVGGLFVSQALTLFTTPVIYIYLDQLSDWISSWRTQTSNLEPQPQVYQKAVAITEARGSSV